MSAECCDYSRVCDARSILVLAVENCSKAVSKPGVEHGKSPRFSRYDVFGVIGVGWRVFVLGVIDGGFFHNCTVSKTTKSSELSLPLCRFEHKTAEPTNLCPFFPAR